ncbi:MAG: hypothetical protein PHP50_13835 [Lachnospiraceae bacterium]|nr:hypothetical protein [Lachnospiraceae bacterium]
MKSGDNTFYYDVQNGVAGYNTDPARGADTFHPFKSAPTLIGTYTGNQSITIDSAPDDATADNFIVEFVSASGGSQTAIGDAFSYSYASTSAMTLEKTYNVSTKTLSVSGMQFILTATHNDSRWRSSGTVKLTYKIWIV